MENLNKAKRKNKGAIHAATCTDAVDIATPNQKITLTNH